MTVDIGTSANLLTGIREGSMVTNTYGGTFIGGDNTAVTLSLPFYPDKIEIFNYTAWATNDDVVSAVWYRGMPAGDALITNRGTATLTTTLETTNGVTITETGPGFAAEQVTITGVTDASPPVVTAASHGLTDNDRVMITKLAGEVGDALNNKQYRIDVLTTNTFALYDVNYNAVAAPGTYTSGGQVNKMLYRGDTENAAKTYSVTFGTAIINDDSDVYYFTCYKYNSYYDLGDQG